jgi:hypothetical protein
MSQDTLSCCLATVPPRSNRLNNLRVHKASSPSPHIRYTHPRLGQLLQRPTPHFRVTPPQLEIVDSITSTMHGAIVKIASRMCLSSTKRDSGPAIASRFRSLSLRSTQRSKKSDISQTPVQVDVLPEFLEPGITGADLTLPLFDGTSSNPEDYLIDLESDSMERYPDVRSYFWRVGQALELLDDVEIEQPSDYQQRLERDDALVKAGREHLRQSRIKGDG